MQYVYLDTYTSGSLCDLKRTRLHKSNYTIYIDLVVLEHAWLLGNYKKLENSLILSLKFWFGKKNKLK